VKNPSYAKLINEVESIISNLSRDDLIKLIINIAENQSITNRNEFLQILKQKLPSTKMPDDVKETLPISPAEFIKEIKEYKQRILDGEFFDEEENYRAYDREEHSYWKNDYHDEFDNEIDFSNEEYVLEAVELLDKAKMFFRNKDTTTAYQAYELLFDIFEDPEYYEEDNYFIYGFSFEDAIDNEVLQEHKSIYLRCKYLKFIQTNDFECIYSAICKESNIFLTDIIEIERSPLPRLDEFVSGFVDFLKGNPKFDRHLINALFVKGGMEEIKRFAYSNGKNHPPVFLYYYEYAKENKFSQSDLIQLILDGIKLIPQKYQTRAYLSLDLIEVAKEANNKNHLLNGYSTAFYSDGSLRNLAFYLDFIISQNNIEEIKKLKNYLYKKDIKGSNFYKNYYYDNIHAQRDIFSLSCSDIDLRALIVGRYILEGIEPLLTMINPEHYLGFSGKLEYVAIITALTLKAISQSSIVIIIDTLVDHYCLNKTSDEYHTLKKLISNTTISNPLPPNYILSSLKDIETLVINRVSHILKNKLRGGYDSACLLLVACAEAKQIVSKNGNDLIGKINKQYKRFSAFRSPLKNFTSQSKHLIAIR